MRLAIFDFNKAILADKVNGVYLLNRGNVYLNMKQYDDALADFDMAIGIDSTNPKFYHAKGLTFQTKAGIDKENEKYFRELAIFNFGLA
jgi:tetratricopeptide (TPR) repeat protein